MKFSILIMILAALAAAGCAAPRSGAAYRQSVPASQQEETAVNTPAEAACLAETTCRLIGSYVSALGSECRILVDENGMKNGFCRKSATYWKPIRLL